MVSERLSDASPALSYWHDSLEPGDDEPRPALGGDLDVDVAIVGAGFSGLWTAYYLCRDSPDLRVVVLERDTCGFGASGRNGGWCVGDQGASPKVLDEVGGAGAAARMIRAVHGAVDEVGTVVAHEGIDCGFQKGGALYFASNPVQRRRLEQRLRTNEHSGLDDAYELWDEARTREVVRAEGVIAALHTPHAAAVHPARLARGVARAAAEHGATIHEGTAVRGIAPGRVDTEHGTVRAEIIVRATEAYTASLAGQGRAILPLGNYMIATEPIDDATWAEIGLGNRELFEDGQLMLGYGQRTADGRIAWGGRSGPYWWGSKVPPSPMHRERVARSLRDRLVEMFPALDSIGVTHHWGGVLGVPRDLRPSVGLDRETGLAWAGGYFGAGVAIANLAGRTLADLVARRSTDITGLPWVDHVSRPWEREPVRWLGVHTATVAAHLADRIDPHRR